MESTPWWARDKTPAPCEQSKELFHVLGLQASARPLPNLIIRLPWKNFCCCTHMMGGAGTVRLGSNAKTNQFRSRSCSNQRPRATSRKALILTRIFRGSDGDGTERLHSCWQLRIRISGYGNEDLPILGAAHGSQCGQQATGRFFTCSLNPQTNKPSFFGHLGHGVTSRPGCKAFVYMQPSTNTLPH